MREGDPSRKNLTQREKKDIAKKAINDWEAKKRETEAKEGNYFTKEEQDMKNRFRKERAAKKEMGKNSPMVREPRERSKEQAAEIQKIELQIEKAQAIKEKKGLTSVENEQISRKIQELMKRRESLGVTGPVLREPESKSKQINLAEKTEGGLMFPPEGPGEEERAWENAEIERLKAELEKRDRQIGELQKTMLEITGEMKSLRVALEAAKAPTREPARVETPPVIEPARVEPQEVPPRVIPPEPEIRQGERLRLRPEVRKERPWSGELVSEVGVVVGKDKKQIKEAIEELIKRREVEYAKEWWQANQYLIEDNEYDFNNTNEKYIVDSTRKLGGFDVLGEDNDLNHLFESREELKKDKVSIDRAQIILHQLQGRKDMLERDTFEARDAGNKRLAKSREKDLEKLLGARERLAGKIIGNDLRQEAKDETWMSSMRRKKTMDAKVEEKIRTADTYESGAGNLRERFAGARKKAEKEFMTEFVEGKIKKDPNAARVFREIERAHERDEEVLKPRDAIREIFTRQQREQGPLSDLEEGGWEINRDNILQFFADSGYMFDPAHLDIANTTLEAMGKPLERALGGDVRLVSWVFDLIFETLRVQSAASRRQRVEAAERR